MEKPGLLVLVLFAALLSPLPAQDFSSIDKDLEQLESLINDTLRDMEEQQKLLEDLQKNLSESGELIESCESVIARQEQSLADLQRQLNEMSETYRKQSALSARYAQSSKFWRTFTLIAIPAAAGLGVWAGIEIGRR
jgi:ElaB/YqjD/DUF883 family membrane-anchored ribosome-binding protein